MKPGIALLLLALAPLSAPLQAMDPQARSVNTVYVLRMSGGLDQYLMTELSRWGVYNVTTDPQKADALFTDSLGEGFEKKYDQLYPPPKSAEALAAEKEAKQRAASGAPSGSLENPLPQQRVGNSSWGRGRGSIFLVDRKSRTVLWSTTRLTEGTGSEQMVEQAQKVVERLRKDLAPPAK